MVKKIKIAIYIGQQRKVSYKQAKFELEQESRINKI